MSGVEQPGEPPTPRPTRTVPPARTDRPHPHTDADAVVVGAGVAGLACARSLAAQGLKAVVLEARERVGGRVWTSRIDGCDGVELGAQVIHGREASTWAVIGEAGLRTEPLALGEDVTIVIGGRGYPSSDLPERGIRPPWVVEAALCSGNGTDAPVAEYLGSLNLSGGTRTLALEWLMQIWGADPADLSIAGMAAIRRSWEGGEGEWRVVDGYDRVPAFLAEGLDVRLDQEVTSITWRRGGVEVKTHGSRLHALAAVVTVPPTVVAGGALRFDPVLPAGKVDAAGRLPFGPSFIVVHRLREPASASTWALVLDGCGGFWQTREGSPFLVAWVKGTRAAVAVAAGTVPDNGLATDVAGALFPGAPPAVVGIEKVVDWTADPWASGGFSYPTAGWIAASGQWAAPVDGTLFFAGEATCGARHPATVQGALESGWRAAGELTAALAS